MANVTLYCSIIRKYNSGLNVSVVMIRVAPFSVPDINAIQPLIQYNELKHNTTSVDLSKLSWDAASSTPACDKQTPKTTEIFLILQTAYFNEFSIRLPFDSPVVPDEQAIIAVSCSPSTCVGLNQKS